MSATQLHTIIAGLTDKMNRARNARKFRVVETYRDMIADVKMQYVMQVVGGTR